MHFIKRKYYNGVQLPLTFTSGLNQGSYQYKIKLMDAIRPEIAVIGSSRAMQVRKQFFKSSFVNLGGISNVAELEAVIDEMAARKQKPELVFVFIDPWWFNKKFAGGGGVAPSSHPVNGFSFPLAASAVKTLKHGNWITKLRSTNNLGIHSILTNEGFEQDGSYHYTSILSGRSLTFDDQLFLNTLARIRDGNNRFEKSEQPDADLLSRTCAALKKLNSQINHTVVIAPPFASVVWKAMAKGGYEYIGLSHNKITECVGTDVFHSFVTGENIPGSTDCEFIDGFHGGDVTYARILSIVAAEDGAAKHYVDTDYLNQFLNQNAGLAGATTRLIFSIKEVDFLKLGCNKTTVSLN